MKIIVEYVYLNSIIYKNFEIFSKSTPINILKYIYLNSINYKILKYSQNLHLNSSCKLF